MAKPNPDSLHAQSEPRPEPNLQPQPEPKSERQPQPRPQPRGKGGAKLTRRQLLTGGAVAGVGAGLAVGLDALRRANSSAPAQQSAAPSPAAPTGQQRLEFYGPHQSGVVAQGQTHVNLTAITLAPDVDRGGLGRLMRILSDDAARLMAGEPPLADSEPELALNPGRLTVTFGFGPGFIARAQGKTPDWLTLPDFGIDRLQPEFSGGDLLLDVAGDDPMAIAHAVRMLRKDVRSFGDVAWTQTGFRHAHGSQPAGTTMRNLFGQIDGTVNLAPGTDDFQHLVWREPDQGGELDWLAGGTTMVLRRIEMDLEGWDRLDRPGREESMGRYLASGAPLTGTQEHDEPDFEALNPAGFPVIAEFSHMRRARSDDPRERFYRRAFNYDEPFPRQRMVADPEAADGKHVSNTGLLFMAYQRDLHAQFVPIQARLDELDLMNKWTTPIGSATFAIPPGCEVGGYIGEGLLG